MKRLMWLMAVLGMLVTLAVPVTGAELTVGGKSALLMEVGTGQVLYEHDSHQTLPPASVTKVMTLLLVMEAIDSGTLDWDDTVTASASAAAKGGSQIYLKEGEQMTVTDMVKAVAVSSANDCACALAEHIAGSEESFVARMNQRAAELGMEDTHFINCTGLDDAPEASGHLTSAHDIAVMSRQLLLHHPEITQFTTIWMDTLRDGQFGLSNTNKLIRFYPGATGLKTGFTSGAGYCLSASARREGMDLVAVVMGCETTQIRTAACKAMLDYGFANYALHTPALTEEIHLKVTMGKEDYVNLIPETDTPILVEKYRLASITTEVLSEPEAVAPVAAGQRLGTLRVTAGEAVLAEIPLVAEQEVQRLTWSDVMGRLLRRLCLG